ncbi:hypothetical protein N9386_01930 [Gammaproteobacteria bacterium]|nr:hypothetical protein [Gammaproteobacteria bacterium]
MEFIVEGKAYWAFTKKPYEVADHNYQVMLVPDAETMTKFEERGHRVQDIKINHDKVLKGVRIAKRKEYGAPPIHDKNQDQIFLDEEIPNGTRVKVKFDEWEMDNQWGQFKGLRLIAIMLMEDLPLPFDKVESY